MNFVEVVNSIREEVCNECSLVNSGRCIIKFQKNKWSCGAAAVVNVLRCYGQKVNEYVIRGLAGTTRPIRDPETNKLIEDGGTSHTGIIRALKEFGYSTIEYKSMSKENAWDWLVDKQSEGYYIILCVEAWEHYVVAAGICKDRVTVIDSSNYNNNKAENGTHTWDKDKLMHKWFNSRKNIENENHRLYAIAVEKR